MDKFSPCPCDSGKVYSKCCRAYHLGEPAPDAQQLMRSRYSAYALRLVDYIVATTDPQGPLYMADREQWLSSIAAFCDHTRFTGLKIHDFVEGEPAYVTFTAYLMQGDQDASFTEKSSFHKRDGQWLYTKNN